MVSAVYTAIQVVFLVKVTFQYIFIVTLKVFKDFNLLFFFFLAPLALVSEKESGILLSSDITGYRVLFLSFYFHWYRQKFYGCGYSSRN